MKFIAIVGTNASKSYNRRLLHFMKKHFAAKAEIVIKEIKEYPLFCEDFDETPHSIMELATEIDHSDGVIFATPEYDHGIPAANEPSGHDCRRLAWKSRHGLCPRRLAQNP